MTWRPAGRSRPSSARSTWAPIGPRSSGRGTGWRASSSSGSGRRGSTASGVSPTSPGAARYLPPSDRIVGDDPRVTDDPIEQLPVEIFLDGFPPAIRDTGLRLRELIRIAVPDAVEGVRSGWSWVGYGLPNKRAK